MKLLLNIILFVGFVLNRNCQFLKEQNINREIANQTSDLDLIQGLWTNIYLFKNDREIFQVIKEDKCLIGSYVTSDIENTKLLFEYTVGFINEKITDSIQISNLKNSGEYLVYVYDKSIKNGWASDFTIKEYFEVDEESLTFSMNEEYRKEDTLSLSALKIIHDFSELNKKNYFDLYKLKSDKN